MPPIAVSLTEELEKFGAYAGLAAFFGFAVLTILYFAQSREVKRLREWAGRAPERAAELEARVAADAARRAALPPRQPPPRQPAAGTAAAVAAGQGAAGTPGASGTPPAPGTPGTAAPGTPPAPGTPGTAAPGTPPAPGAPGATPAPGAPGATPAPDGAPAAAPAPGAPGQQPAPDGEPAAAPAGDAPATAAGTQADEKPPAGAPATPGPDNGSGAPPSVPVIPRATPEPARAGSGGATPPRTGSGGAPPPRRPAPALRQSAPPSRRPGQPPVRRPGAPAEAPAERGPGRTALAVGGAVLGLILAVVIGTQLLGGDEERPAPNVPTPAETTPAPDPAEEPAEASAPARGDTTVAVLNGTTVTGLAAQIADDIEEAGFLRGTTANYSDQARSASLVFHEEEFRRRAQEVARIMELPAEDIEAMTEDVRTLAGDADVVVVVGADQAP